MPDMRLFGLYFLAVFFLSQSPIWVRWSHAPIEVLGAGRLLLAAFLILPWTKKKDWQAWWAQSPSQKLLLLLAGVGLFAHLWTYKFASQNTSVANLMILFASNPIWMALMIRKAVSKYLALAYGLCFTGLLVLGFQQFNLNSATFAGDVLAIVTAFLYSLYLFLSQKSRAQCEHKVFSFNLFFIAALGFLITAWIREVPLLPLAPQSLMAIAGLAICSTILGHGIFVLLVDRMKLTWMTCGKLLEPVLASLSAWLMFGENLSLTHLLSFLLVAVGVLILILKESPKEHLPKMESDGQNSLSVQK